MIQFKIHSYLVRFSQILSMLRQDFLHPTTSTRAWTDTQRFPRCLWTLRQRLLKRCKLVPTQARTTSTGFSRSSNRHIINRREIPLHQMPALHFIIHLFVQITICESFRKEQNKQSCLTEPWQNVFSYNINYCLPLIC